MVRKGQKWECPAGKNQKYPHSTYKECRNSGLLAEDVDDLWHNTFQGQKFCTEKKKKTIL